jgi:uncharacterized protein (DUF2147 family)
VKRLVYFILIITQVSYCQSIVGRWKTIDTKTQKELSIIEISKNDEQYTGKLVKILNVLRSHSNCPKCSAKIKNNSLIEKDVLVDLQKEENEYYGFLIDPFSDKIYNCTIKIISQNTLEINAYRFLPIFGRTQKWERIISKE